MSRYWIRPVLFSSGGHGRSVDGGRIAPFWRRERSAAQADVLGQNFHRRVQHGEASAFSERKRDTLKLVTALFCRFCRHGFADWKTSRVE
jgi:hypothetical protein